MQKKANKKMTLEGLAALTVNEINKLESKLTTEIRSTVDKAKEELKTEINKKVDIFTHNDLKFRVEKLEERVGIARKK
ncbi:MAG: hypothetical protein WCV59_02975 [Parcubacteria group bacterium]